MAQVFARGQDENFSGLTPGFLEGVRHQTLVRGRAPRHRGVCLGRVQKVEQAAVWVRISAPVQKGEGVVFDCGRPDEDETGGTIIGIRYQQEVGLSLLNDCRTPDDM